MPLPFLLGALAVGAGVLGVGGHLAAKDTNERAQRVAEDAQDLYNSAKRSLEQAQNATEKALLKLGYEKKNVLDSSMKVFLNSYEKVKNIELKESVGLDEISNFAIDQQGAIQLREMTDIYSSTIKSGATGATAGAVVALAASGSLTVVTGGLATAGSALLAGEVTAAAGIAGSALSFGAAMTPLAAVAAPVVLFTGISASMKADENLEKANAMYAEAEEASEKMKVSETLCNAISKRSDMFDDLLIDLNSMFAECAGVMAGVIRKKEGRIFKKKLSSNDFTEDELKLMAVTRSLAGAVKSVIDTPILSKDGNIAYESEKTYEQTIEKLPDFNNAVEEVRQIDFEAKPIDATVVSKNNVRANTSSTSNSILGKTRNVFAVVIGIIIASAFASSLALIITQGSEKFWFMNSLSVNTVSLWMVIFSTLTMIIGHLYSEKFINFCGFLEAVGLSLLYVQFCRTVEMMNHYIIFSVIMMIVALVLWNFFDGKKKKWACGSYVSNICFCMASFPFFFLAYALLSKLIGISTGFCLVLSTLVNAFFVFAFMLQTTDSGSFTNNTISKSNQKTNSLTKNDFTIYHDGNIWNFYDKFAHSDAWYTYVNGDNFHTNRGVSFPSKLVDVTSLYGHSNTYPFNEDSDIFLRIGNDNQSQDILRLKTATKYIYYSNFIGGDKVSISFYFDSDNNLLLVGYLLGDLSR